MESSGKAIRSAPRAGGAARRRDHPFDIPERSPTVVLICPKAIFMNFYCIVGQDSIPRGAFQRVDALSAIHNPLTLALLCCSYHSLAASAFSTDSRMKLKILARHAQGGPTIFSGRPPKERA